MPPRRKQSVTPRALLELKMPDEVRVAPDGRRVAFSLHAVDWDDHSLTQHLFLVDVAGDAPPRQITRGREGEQTPRWSPDGKWLAFLTTRPGDTGADEEDYDEDEEPRTQIWLLPMDGGGGEAEKLTDAPEGVEVFDWMPDSSAVIFLAREPRRKSLQTAYDDRQERKDDAVVEREERFRQQIWRIGREDKKAALVHPGDLGIGELAVAPDGKTVAYTTNYTGEVNDYHKVDVWALDLATGAVQALTEGPGGKFHPVWTPDGSAVLFACSLDPDLSFSQENLYSVPAAGGPVRHVTATLGRDVTGWHSFCFDAAGALYVSVALGTTTAIFRQAAGDDEFAPVLQAGEHIYGFHVAPGGGIAYVASGAVEVPELLWLPPGTDQPETLTDFNEDWYDQYALAPVACVSWPADDGLEIEGLLTSPADDGAGRPYPLIVLLHGGPHGRAVQSLSPYNPAQAYAAAGYAVLEPNYRGSEGYGAAFCVASRGDLGGGDYRDVLAGVDWAIRAGVADPERLAVTGDSYGGYLTNWIIGHTSRFKAAVSRFGIFSLSTDFSNSQAPRWEQEYLGAAPWDAAELYARLSPASFVSAIRTPVLILHGEADQNTFIANSQEMYTALHLLGRTVQYVHYPREGHGFSETLHRLDEVHRTLAWFDTYVQGGGRPVRRRVGERIRSGDWELCVVSAAVAAYAGRAGDRRRYLEVAFVLRDVAESGASLTLRPGDVSLGRGLSSTGRSGRPAGLPLEVLGEKVLAEGSGWKFVFAPGKEERGLAVPVALAFRITNAGGPYALAVRDFPPVTIEVPAAEDKAAEADKNSADR